MQSYKTKKKYHLTSLEHCHIMPLYCRYLELREYVVKGDIYLDRRLMNDFFLFLEIHVHILEKIKYWYMLSYYSLITRIENIEFRNRVPKKRIMTIRHFHQYFQGSSWSWSCGSWIYNYLCNQCLSPLKLWVLTPFMVRCTRYNIMW